jgi:predicted enzyme related to lactoylglutathione lyase
MANQVVHFEIMGKDAPALRDFYKSAFDWQFQAVGGPVDYQLVSNAGIGGGIGQCPGGQGHVRFYVAVDDIAATLEKVQRLGAKSVEGPWPLPTGGHIASFVDPQGQSIGLVQQ